MSNSKGIMEYELAEKTALEIAKDLLFFGYTFDWFMTYPLT